MNMNERSYKKRLDFQNQIISRQSQQIKNLEEDNEKLKERLKEKDEILNSIEPMRKEMKENINEYRSLKDQYKRLADELKQMKKIMNVTVYKGKWRLVKWLIK